MINKIKGHSQNIKDALRGLSDAIYKNPEIGFEEVQAAKNHVALLREHGFTVEEHYNGIDTAFRAEYVNHNREKPITLAYLCEYDALPGLGHGCGHNLLGAASTGAGIVLSKIVADINESVKIVVYGTPAEETSGTKVEMVKDGCFDGVDFVMMSHPGDDFYKSGDSLAMRALEFEFFGKASHAAAAPEMGINALDGVLNTFISINALRQQVKATARIHGIIPNGGEAPNIIPDYTNAKFYVRAQSVGYLEELVERVIRCAEFGASAAGCTMKYNDFEASYKNLITNKTLSDVYTNSLQELGVAPVLECRKNFGSLDAGDVSHVVPTIHPYHKIAPKGTAAHTVEFAEFAGSDDGFEGTIMALEGMVLTAYNVITNDELLKEIKAEFDKGQEK